ncbi:hypothetical protein SAMN04487760_106173 [Lachnospiraceae bacterium G41]|nr:hypothetical protein SAMN04487760_106173 [Lachnospiraceae bacterium G41]
MAKKKKSENEPNIEEKITEVEEQKADEYEGLTDAEKLLLAKEERFLDKEEEEEEPEEEDDSALGKVKKSIGFFIDYYKWFVIIPAIIIVITIIMITSYLSESRERALELSIVNAKFEIPDLMYAVENDFIDYTGENITGDDIRIVYDLQYPDTSSGSEAFSTAENISMQKFNASVIAGRVDIALTESWVVNDYSVTNATLDLRELFDEEFLKDHEDKVYYARDASGEKIPVAFYIDAKIVKDAYPDDAKPLAVSFDSSKHREEARRFMEWLLSQSE